MRALYGEEEEGFGYQNYDLGSIVQGLDEGILEE
jgi:hypothetical protein